jgi:DNA polymerase I-like protein with 3'-5' exonuclease and polymerase domains
VATLDVKHAVGVDFETKPIDPLPAPPPAPVGVAIQWPGKRAVYYAFGHATENTHTRSQARSALRDVYRSGQPILGHNFLHFDAPVAEEHFDLPQPPHDNVIDTQAWAFLAAPNEIDLGLKPLCEKWLGEPPVERDAVRSWIFDNVPGAKKARTKWGQHIWRAPGTLVGAYAIGDVTRPRRLAEYLLPQIAALREPLDLEQWWLQQATRMERRGVPIAVRRLSRDRAAWARSLDATEHWIRRRIKSPSAPLVGDALADALEKAGLCNVWEGTDEPAWNLTPKKRRSTKHADLRLTCADPELVAALRYFGLLSVYKRTFADEWLRQARITNGVCHFAWNTVRHAKDEDGGESSSKAVGARTGRMSSTPNAQNLPKRPREVCFTASDAARIAKEGAEVIRLPRALAGKIAPLPNMRDYIVPPKGAVVLDRDFAGQELRIFAHRTARFGGVARDAYLKSPRMNFHRWVTDLVNAMLGTTFSRGAIKNVVFAILYGAGLVKLAAMLNASVEEAQRVRAAVREALPELVAAERWYKSLEAKNEPFFTIGGRRYMTEERLFTAREDGEMEARSFAYKNLNTDIQGSAADQTKRAGRIAIEHGLWLPLITHDQLTTFSPPKTAKRTMLTLRKSMEEGTQALLTVPVVSDGQWSQRSWGTLEPYKEAV